MGAGIQLKWLDEASAWLTYDLIMACEDPDAGKPEKYQGGRCFIGNDIASRNDLWVAWVWEAMGDVADYEPSERTHVLPCSECAAMA